MPMTARRACLLQIGWDSPLAVETLSDLPAMLARHRVELRLMESLVPLRDVWSTSLHASGVHLRHAQGWAATPEGPTR